jgi:hypothetical protein
MPGIDDAARLNEVRQHLRVIVLFTLDANRVYSSAERSH